MEAATQVEGETPEVEGETPEVEGETPEVEGGTPEVEGETPEVEGETPEVEGETPEADEEAPAIASVKVVDAQGVEIADVFTEGTFTVEQGTVISSIEITMSEAVTLSEDVTISITDDTVLEGVPDGLEIAGIYGTVALKQGTDNVLVITPGENRGEAGFVGTVTFMLDGELADLSNNLFNDQLPTLMVTAKQ